MIIIDNDLVQLNNLFTKRHLVLFVLWSQRRPTVIPIVEYPGARCRRCPRVAVEPNPGVEPSPTGWANVGGDEVLDACCTGLVHLLLLLCSGSSAFFSCPSSNANQAASGGMA